MKKFNADTYVSGNPVITKFESEVKHLLYYAHGGFWIGEVEGEVRTWTLEGLDRNGNELYDLYYPTQRHVNLYMDDNNNESVDLFNSWEEAMRGIRDNDTDYYLGTYKLS